MPEKDDDNGNGFPTEEEPDTPDPVEAAEIEIAPDRPDDDEGFPTTPEQ